MSERSTPDNPFKTLGTHLRYLREQLKQSLAEVSGAVEIDQKVLERIEAGAERPAEDILLLLISHFEVQDNDAVQLWELAGYESEASERIRPGGDVQQPGKNVVMFLAFDMRTVYTDSLDVHSNQAGVVLNFSQTAGQDRSVPVARLGMSYDQAEQVVQTMQQALLKAKYLHGPKALPPRAQQNLDDKRAQN